MTTPAAASKKRTYKHLLTKGSCFFLLGWLSYINVDVPLTSASEEMSAYSSMRALDEFGNSIQLKRAREAAVRHGRLVVAAVADELHSPGDIVVVSVGKDSLVRPLTLPLTRSKVEKKSGMVAMCCTGIKSDADWLVRNSQVYSADVWRRYDHCAVKASAFAHEVARILGGFQEKDSDEEWQSAMQRRRTKEDSSSERFELSLSRPLGVQALVLSTNGDAESEANLLLVEPTGRIFKADSNKDFSFIAIGKQSDTICERLSRSMMDNVDGLEHYLMREILQVLAPSRNEVTDILVEIISQDSIIERKYFSFQNGRAQASTQVP